MSKIDHQRASHRERIMRGQPVAGQAPKGKPEQLKARTDRAFQTDMRTITVKFTGRCERCRKELKAGTGAWWQQGILRCHRCGPLTKEQAQNG